MTLGTHPGGKGWIFMRSPNNVIFSAAQATFDEAFFPKCPAGKGVRQNTRLQTPAPKYRPCPCKGMRMMMIMKNRLVDHQNLLQLPQGILRGKRELGRTTIPLGHPHRSSLHGLPPLTFLKSLPRRLKLADPNGTLRSLGSQEMCMEINISHKSKKKSGNRGTGAE